MAKYSKFQPDDQLRVNLAIAMLYDDTPSFQRKPLFYLDLQGEQERYAREIGKLRQELPSETLEQQKNQHSGTLEEIAEITGWREVNKQEYREATKRTFIETIKDINFKRLILGPGFGSEQKDQPEHSTPTKPRSKQKAEELKQNPEGWGTQGLPTASQAHSNEGKKQTKGKER